MDVVLKRIRESIRRDTLLQMAEEEASRLERLRYAAWAEHDRLPEGELREGAHEKARSIDDKYLIAVWRLAEIKPEWTGT